MAMLICSGTSHAKLIEPESLLLQILESNRKVGQCNLAVRVSVFDPEEFAPLDEDIEDNWIPYELADKSYLQKVIWRRDEFLYIETTDLLGDPLHIYVWEFGGKEFSRNLQLSRLFQTEDVLLPYLIFFTKHLPVIKRSLNTMGIAPFSVQLEQRKSQNVYLLGLGDEKLLVDPDTFQVLEIHRSLQIWGRNYSRVARFFNWDSVKQRIPMATQMYINGRLYKEIHVEEIRFGGVTSQARRFLKTYSILFLSKSKFSLSTVYGK